MDRYSDLEKFVGKGFEFPSSLNEEILACEKSCLYVASCDKTTFLYVENSFQEITGYSIRKGMESDLTFWFSLVHQDDKSQLAENIIERHRQMVSPGFKIDAHHQELLKLEYRLKREDGQWIWLREIKYPIFNGERLDKILGILIDITADRQLIEENANKKISDPNAWAGGLLNIALRHKESTRKMWIRNPNDNISKQPEGIALLTKREKEVLQLIGEGFSSKNISGKLGISINTVETHRKHLLEKLKVKNSMELIKEASKVFWF